MGIIWAYVRVFLLTLLFSVLWFMIFCNIFCVLDFVLGNFVFGDVDCYLTNVTDFYGFHLFFKFLTDSGSAKLDAGARPTSFIQSSTSYSQGLVVHANTVK